MVRRADLDEALQEEPRFAVLLTPDALEDFVRLEEVAVVEEADAFLDRIEPVRLASDHRPSYRPAADEGFGLRLADDDLPDVSAFRARERISALRAKDRDRRYGGWLAVGQNLDLGTGGQRLEGLLRLDERIRAQQAPGVDHAGRDRKSTRLNSSHVKISYAV